MQKSQPVKIIYEDNHLIAANKPARMLTHADDTGDWTLMDEIKRYIKWKYNKPGDVFLGSFHRIDRPATGVVIYAKTSKGLARMNNLIRERQITKKYLVITEGRPENPSNKLTHFLEKDRKRNVSKAYDVAKKNRKESVLTYNLLGYIGNTSLIDVNLLTGRSHQIRVQMSKIGVPIYEDFKYGAVHPIHNQSVALHCSEMSFVHPVKKEPISIKAEVPEYFPWSNFKDFFA